MHAGTSGGSGQRRQFSKAFDTGEKTVPKQSGLLRGRFWSVTVKTIGRCLAEALRVAGHPPGNVADLARRFPPSSRYLGIYW
jgi:hypothetical protein